jgi:hypothetical protein
MKLGFFIQEFGELFTFARFADTVHQIEGKSKKRLIV